MFWFLTCLNIVFICAGFSLIFINVRPDFLQLLFFAIALCFPALLNGYGSNFFVLALFVVSLVGISLAAAQILGYLQIGPTGTLPIL